MTDDMFTNAAARRIDPTTSHAAAVHLRGAEATRIEGQVLDALRESPDGLTTHELVSRTGLPWNTVSPRLKPLWRKGLVRDSMNRRSGPDTKRRCIVWQATN